MGAEDVDGPGQDFGEFPGPAALLGAEGLFRRLLASLVGAQADTDGALEVLLLGRLEDGDLLDQMFQGVARQAIGLALKLAGRPISRRRRR